MKKILLYLFLTSCIASPLNAMQSAASKVSERFAVYYAKKTFSGLMTTLHWTIAAGPSLYSGVHRIKMLSDEEKFLNDNNGTNPEQPILDFMATVLPPHTPVKITTASPNAMALAKHVCIAPWVADEIDKAIKSNDQQVLAKWRAVLEHEKTHIKYNDVAWGTAIDILSPFVTHGSLKILRNTLPWAKKTRTFFKEQFIKIPTAFAKANITIRSKTAITRYQEQRADNSISK